MVFFIVNKSRRYLNWVVFIWPCISWVNFSVTDNEKIYIWLEQDTDYFFFHSDNHDLFSLTFLQTSNIQWDFFVPLHQSFPTHGMGFEVNWSAPCWSKMKVRRGSEPWSPLQTLLEPPLQDWTHSNHRTETPARRWGPKDNILQRQQSHSTAVDENDDLNIKK